MSNFLDSFRGSGPLREVTIIDFSQMMMGPLATQLMGDLGALVVKVERPGTGEWERSYLPRGRRLHGESPYFLAMNRNKLSFTADLKSPADRPYILGLVKHADAVIHNFRPGVMERLGLGYEEFLAHNPRLVYASGSGYGPAGPMVNRPGQDLLLQAMSGLAANSGDAGGPPTPIATPIVDASAGFLLAFSVISAVLDARLTGAPRRIDVSLLGTALLIQCQEALVALNTDLQWERSSSGIAAPWNAAPYGIYQTSDGSIAIAMTPREQLTQVFELPTGLLQLDEEGWFEARDAVNKAIQKQVKRRSTADWLERLAAHDFWAAPVFSLQDALAHPQVQANQYVETMRVGNGKTVEAVGLPARMSGVAKVDRLPPPRVGEHNDMIRRTLDDLNS
jgi:crotonobetainyl-CoA:carnitine CoA-transferase CaiB-like acyl-CoA transferase